MVSAAAVNNESVCGLILVSGAGRPFGDILREQLKANPANKPILEEAFAAIEKLEGAQKVDSTKLHNALPAQVHRDLTVYAEILGAENGQLLEPAKLIALMLERFMKTDRRFAKLRKERRSSSPRSAPER